MSTTELQEAAANTDDARKYVRELARRKSRYRWDEVFAELESETEEKKS